MYTPTLEDFLERAKRGNLIPVYRELVADIDTPVSAYLKLSGVGNGHSFLLESVAGNESVARYSYLGCSPYRTLASRGNDVILTTGGSQELIKLRDGQDPLHIIKDLMSQYQFVPPDAPDRFHGGAVGYLSYDMVRFFEDLPDENPDDLELPECQFMFTDTLVVFDHVMNRMRIVANAHITDDPQAAYWEAVERIDRLVEALELPLPEQGRRQYAPRIPDDPSAMKSTMTKSRHREAVLRAKEYITAGDVIQVVISHRLSAELPVAPFDLYRALRAINPSPYMYYLSFGDTKVIGASPELLVREEHGNVVTRPIAGTRRRGANEAEDRALAEDLLADEKERAEHIMLVDLHRNDIGRVCRPGTVAVDEFMDVEHYSHVMHIVSNVIGELADDYDQYDVLRSVFPAGTVSGAPKIRAMEIIEELEPVRRGPYAGVIGYFGFSGSMDTCITLRTIIGKNGTYYFQAGGGIVADSDPDKEYEETLLKIGALLDAARLAERGFV
jgi:anthranilate synthase component I